MTAGDYNSQLMLQRNMYVDVLYVELPLITKAAAATPKQQHPKLQPDGRLRTFVLLLCLVGAWIQFQEALKNMPFFKQVQRPALACQSMLVHFGGISQIPPIEGVSARSGGLVAAQKTG